MMAWGPLYQVHPRYWLAERAHQAGLSSTLETAGPELADRLAALGFEWAWLLGVWQTGEAGRAVSRESPSLWEGYRHALPDVRLEDVCGSPFAIRSYDVHQDFGGDPALARFRASLAQRGLKLMLDFVPNHVAPDHLWATEHPEFFIQGSAGDLAREPENYTTINGHVLARGRDPFFPGWPDTLQLNYRHAGLRQAMIGELRRVAQRCDGVRCDMAMLLLPDVIARTWGDRARPSDGSAPVDAPFWPEAIEAVRTDHPNFTFLAEVYWDLEAVLQAQGFDLTYDKRLYDRLRAGDAPGVRAHLGADEAFQRRCARFLENHDEPRAASAFPPERHPAAAVVTYLTPGLRFFHDGQLEGRRVAPSIHLARRQVEPVDPRLKVFYAMLLKVLTRPEVRDGRWRQLLPVPAWDGNPTWDRFLGGFWDDGEGHRLLTIANYGPTQGQCYLPLPFDDLTGRSVALRDLLGPSRYVRHGDELRRRGLYLDLPAWGYHAFEVKMA